MKCLTLLFSLFACSLQGFPICHPCPPPVVCGPVFVPPPPPPMWVPPPQPRYWVPVHPHYARPQPRCCCRHYITYPTRVSDPVMQSAGGCYGNSRSKTIAQPAAPQKAVLEAKILPAIAPAPLTGAEVKDVVTRFVQLVEGEGHLVDIFDLIDPSIVIREGDQAYTGMRGIEDYCRDRPVEYTEEERAVLSMEITLSGDLATVKSVEAWSAVVHSQPVKAHMTYTWVLKRDAETGKALIVSQTLDNFTVLEESV